VFETILVADRAASVRRGEGSFECASAERVGSAPTVAVAFGAI
jgi:hypothetical protein